MSAARLEKLRCLLKRVEQRSAQPRLRAVQAATHAAPAVESEDPELSISEGPDTLPPDAPDELSFDSERPDEPATLPPVASAPTQRALEPAQVAPSSLPPAAEPAAARAPTPAPSQPVRPAAKSPIEDAMALLPDLGPIEDSGPLQVQALAEPITTPQRALSDAPAGEDPHLMVTHRPQAKASLPDVTFIPASPAPVIAPTGGVREPTIEFALRPQPGVVPRAMEPVLLERAKEPELLAGPTQTLEAAPLASATPPAQAVSAVRIEEPKSFGELLELSLSLRPR